MNERRITSGDRRARALQLKPGKRQNNAWSRNFTCSKARTLGEAMEAERYSRALGHRD
jgi:hypothetical protein